MSLEYFFTSVNGEYGDEEPFFTIFYIDDIYNNYWKMYDDVENIWKSIAEDVIKQRNL